MQIDPFSGWRGKNVRVNPRNAGAGEDFTAGSEMPPDVGVFVEEAAKQKRQRHQFDEQQTIEPSEGRFRSHSRGYRKRRSAAAGRDASMRSYTDHPHPDNP